MWGLGATLHYALTGAAPFPRPAGARAAPAAHRAPSQLGGGVPWLRAEVPDPIRDLVLRMLAVDPAARPSPRQNVEERDPAWPPFRPGCGSRAEAGS